MKHSRRQYVRDFSSSESQKTDTTNEIRLAQIRIELHLDCAPCDQLRNQSKFCESADELRKRRWNRDGFCGRTHCRGAGSIDEQRDERGAESGYQFRGHLHVHQLESGLIQRDRVAPGFKSSTADQVDVQIGGTTRADLALEVGDVTESVTVTSATADLQTDNASLGGVIEGGQVQEAPLNGRNVNNLLDFVPGVVPGGGTAGSTVANGGTGQVSSNTQAISYGNYQIGGAFSGQSLFFIDGVGSNISENNVNTLVPTQDAVQEFRVSTNNVSAEFGGYGGGVVQISTKSGTESISWKRVRVFSQHCP